VEGDNPYAALLELRGRNRNRPKGLYVKGTPPTWSVCASIPLAHAERLYRIANARNVRLSVVTREAVAEYLARRGDGDAAGTP